MQGVDMQHSGKAALPLTRAVVGVGVSAAGMMEAKHSSKDSNY
jgi:hypothetical protein